MLDTSHVYNVLAEGIYFLDKCSPLNFNFLDFPPCLFFLDLKCILSWCSLFFKNISNPRLEPTNGINSVVYNPCPSRLASRVTLTFIRHLTLINNNFIKQKIISFLFLINFKQCLFLVHIANCSVYLHYMYIFRNFSS